MIGKGRPRRRRHSIFLQEAEEPGRPGNAAKGEDPVSLKSGEGPDLAALEGDQALLADAVGEHFRSASSKRSASGRLFHQYDIRGRQGGGAFPERRPGGRVVKDDVQVAPQTKMLKTVVEDDDVKTGVMGPPAGGGPVFPDIDARVWAAQRRQEGLVPRLAPCPRDRPPVGKNAPPIVPKHLYTPA